VRRPLALSLVVAMNCAICNDLFDALVAVTQEQIHKEGSLQIAIFQHDHDLIDTPTAGR